MKALSWSGRCLIGAMALATCASAGCATTLSRSDARRAQMRALRAYTKSHYAKREYQIPMRDGVKLFTAVYTPKDTSKKYPVILHRRPYAIGPYGEDKYRTPLGPSPEFTKDGFIFVYQDVRGKYMSEGTFVNMRPHIDNKQSTSQIDESSDTYDTIDWVLKNIPNHNGRVGLWGISYPGYYSSAGMIDAHPALKAVSPQAPVADWFFDDFHHHGAFFLPHSFNFMASFDQPRPEPTTEHSERFEHETPDAYQFFLDLGPIKNANERYFHDELTFWNKMMEHPNYDEFWQAQNILPHLNNVAPAVMTVGGWFDAEDLYGALMTYAEIERRNPDVSNIIVMGPWAHGQWSRGDGESLGNIHFGAKTSVFYREEIEFPFFQHHLKDGPDPNLPEAYVFETGVNRWRTFDHWPPRETETQSLYFQPDGGLAFALPPDTENGFDEYVSDPAKPVPFTEAVSTGMTRAYMTDDQRFASRRTDVLTYQTDVLDDGVTLAGPITADLWVSTSGTASDWIVKVIDVFPPDTEDHEDVPRGMHMGGYQMMVRSEVIRGRFRNSYEHPEPFVANEPTNVRLTLQDVLHTFQPGHRIMVQIQSTWFPLVDRNPHDYVDNVFFADEEDFVKATQRVYRTGAHATRLEVGVLPPCDDEVSEGATD
ncbi:MAG: CocE/NonD family hydrolase [Planctomycetes bacterium]|nr:CocE/NonD family hydrolase [Planctomycetota bacterium]